MAERQVMWIACISKGTLKKKKFKKKGTLTQQIFRVTITFTQNFPIMQPCALHKRVTISVARDDFEALEDAGIPSVAPKRRAAGD